MPNKEYKFRDEVFTASANVLKTHNLAIPIQKYFAEELERQISGLNLKAMNEDKSKIDNIKYKIQANAEYLSSLKDNTEKKRVEKIQSGLEKELEKLTKIFNENNDYKELVKQYQEATNRTFELLITEEILIIPFLEKYLIGNTDKLDYTDVSILKFISEVITDFFLLLSENKKKLNLL